MRKFFDKILRPQRTQLIFFGIFVSPILLYGLLVISLAWMMGDMLLKAVYIALIILFIATWLHDRYNNTRLKSYIYVTTVLLTVYMIVLFPNRKYLKLKSEIKGLQLAEYVEMYRKQFGKYPENLDNEFFKEAPHRSYLGTMYTISTSVERNEKDTICYLEYQGLHGYIGVYNLKTKQWYYVD